MPVFEYKATDANGRQITGTVIGASLVAAADSLAKQGLTVQHVALAAAAGDPIPTDFKPPTPAASPAARRVEQLETEIQNLRSEIEKRQRQTQIKAQPAAEAPRVEQASASERRTPVAGGRYERIVQEQAPSPYPGVPPTEARSVLMTDVVGPLLLKVPLDQLLFFFRQLSTMLNAGVPIISSLDTLARQTRDPRLNGVVRELAAHVREGRELSVGMQRYPEIFTPLMLSLVRAGEQGGLLDTVLKQIADYIEREIELRNLIRKSTLYPKVILFCSIFIVLAANFVIRNVLGKPGGIQTPLTEPVTWLVLGPLVILLFLFFRVGATNPRFKNQYDQILLMIPGIGPTVRQMAMAKFSRAFAALYHGGVPITKAVQLSAEASGSGYLSQKIQPAARMLEEGSGITDAFVRTGAFTGPVLEMTATGETTGRLDEMLDKVADFYENDSTVKANQLAIILGVVCFLIVGVYVLYIVYTFWTGYASERMNLPDAP